MLPARLVLAGALAASAVWAYVLLDRSPDWNPWLKVSILAAGLGASALIVASPLLSRPFAIAVAGLAVVATLAGPAAYTLDTVVTSYGGAIPSAGPSVMAANFGPGGNGGALRQLPAGTFNPPPGGFSRGGPAAPGNFLQASQVSSELEALLGANASSYRWVAATINANSAASYELATGEAVMAIGGFNGSDPAPTLAQFQDYVSKRQIHYFIGGSMRGGGTSSEIESWVSRHFTATTVGNVTIYDLTKPTS